MTLTTYIAYVIACFAVVIVPGPSVTVIIANSIHHGTRAGLMNVAGTQAGLAIMLAILAVGLQTIVTVMGDVFEVVRLIGAAYLIWLGLKMWRSHGALAAADETTPVKAQKDAVFFWQGLLVILSNPKALLFFGAFIPQFVDIEHHAAAQTLWLGLTFMIVATVFDGLYAVAAGRARQLITTRRIKLVGRVSGSLLIGGGLWLALARR